MQAPIVTIRSLHEYVGQEVTLQGWLLQQDRQGQAAVFLQVRDGAGICQAVVFRDNVSPEEDFEIAKSLTQESSVIVRGVVRADPRAPGHPRRLRDGRARHARRLASPTRTRSTPRSTASSS
jgi:aspartyl/asparaginyl-tRNA synthetase